LGPSADREPVLFEKVDHGPRRPQGDLGLTVRAMAAPLDHAHPGLRQRPSYRVELSGLGAGIAIAMQDEHGDRDLAQAAIEEIGVRVRGVLDRSPGRAFAPQELLPVRLAERRQRTVERVAART
jgi:hypothetical protein